MGIVTTYNTCVKARLWKVLLLTAFSWAGTLYAWPEGNVVPCWSMAESKRQKWFIAELTPESRTFTMNGAIFEIAEAWVEKAHVTDYVLLFIPKRVTLQYYWVCMRIKGKVSPSYGYYGGEFFRSLYATEQSPPGIESIRMVHYRALEPVFYAFEPALRTEYIYSRVTQATQYKKRTHDIVFRMVEKPDK